MRRGRLLALAALLSAPALAETAHFIARAPVTVPARFAPEFGGISGIDRDPRSGRWYLISDDRAERAPARFYLARIDLARDGTPRARLLARRALRDAANAPLQGEPPPQTPDAESIRVDPAGNLVWASEGNAGSRAPIVRITTTKGREIGRLSLPSNLTNEHEGQGARANLAIEGLAFSPSRTLWLAMEAPLIEDGDVAAVGRPAIVRFTRRAASGETSQYAYAIDAVPADPGVPADNGVSEILMLDEHRLLVLERSGRRRTNGGYDYDIRLYLAETADADEISRIASLRDQPVRPMAKTLLFDFAAIPGRPVANLESMAWVKERDGRRRLLLVNDDNFDPEQPTEMIVLGIE